MSRLRWLVSGLLVLSTLSTQSLLADAYYTPPEPPIIIPPFIPPILDSDSLPGSAPQSSSSSQESSSGVPSSSGTGATPEPKIVVGNGGLIGTYYPGGGLLIDDGTTRGLRMFIPGAPAGTGWKWELGCVTVVLEDGTKWTGCRDGTVHVELAENKAQVDVGKDGVSNVISPSPSRGEQPKQTTQSVSTSRDNKITVVFGTDLTAFLEKDQVVVKAKDCQGNTRTMLKGVPICYGVDTKTRATTMQCFFTGGERVNLLHRGNKEKLTLLQLKNGKQVKGVVTDCTNSSIKIKTPEVTEVRWEEVSRIASPFFCTITGEATGARSCVPLSMVSSTGSIYGNVQCGFSLVGWLQSEPSKDSGKCFVPVSIFEPGIPRVQTGAAYVAGGQIPVETRVATGLQNTTVRNRTLTAVTPEVIQLTEMVDDILQDCLTNNPYSMPLDGDNLKRVTRLERRQEKKDKNKGKNLPKNKEGEGEDDSEDNGGEQKPEGDKNTTPSGKKKISVDGLPPVDPDVVVQKVIEMMQRMRRQPIDPVPPSGDETAEGKGKDDDGGKNTTGGDDDGNKTSTGKGNEGGVPESPVKDFRLFFGFKIPDPVLPRHRLFPGSENTYETKQPTENSDGLKDDTKNKSDDRDSKQSQNTGSTEGSDKIAMVTPGAILGGGAPISLVDAQRDGLCDISIRSNNDPNHCEVMVTSTKATFIAQIPEKLCFLSSDPGASQNLMEATDPVFSVPAGKTVTIPIETYCISTKSIKPPPSTGLKYTAAKHPDQKMFSMLVRIAQSSEKMSTEGVFNDVPVAPERRSRKIAQTAIWMYLGQNSGKKSERITVESLKEDLLKSAVSSRDKLSKEQLQRVESFAQSIYDASHKTVERAKSAQ